MKIYRLLVLVGGILLMVGAALPWEWSASCFTFSGKCESGYSSGFALSRSSRLGSFMHTAPTAAGGGILVLIALINRGKPGKAYSRLAIAISVLCGLQLAGTAFTLKFTYVSDVSYSPVYGLLCVSPPGALLGLLGGATRVSEKKAAMAAWLGAVHWRYAARRALLMIAAFVCGAGAFYLSAYGASFFLHLSNLAYNLLVGVSLIAFGAWGIRQLGYNGVWRILPPLLGSAVAYGAALLLGFSFIHAPTPPRTPVPSLNSTPTARPSAAPRFPAIPTLTSTPVPPLVAHEWTQSEPLIIYGTWGGYPTELSGVLPVDLTLLPSGDLYLLRRIENLPDEVILTTTLSRQATCHLLNSIDQAGFLDYDPSSYGSPFVSDTSTTHISVHAWRANSVSLYAFSLDWKLTKTTILPAIRDTYWLLEDYQPPGNLHILKPERLGVWLKGQPLPAGTDAAVEWPLKSYTLAAASSAGSDPAMILTGADATQVYNALGETLSEYGAWNVKEGDKLYTVFARPLLPNEFNSSPLPQVALSCSPSDGSIQKP